MFRGTPFSAYYVTDKVEKLVWYYIFRRYFHTPTDRRTFIFWYL